MENFDFARPFQYLMGDPAWLKKVLLGGLFILIPIIGPFVLMGYSIRIMRQVADGNDAALPEWDQFGDDLVTGLKAFVVVLGWIAPGLIIYIGATIVGIGVAAAMGNHANDNPLPGLVMMGGTCLGFPLLGLGALLSPIGVLRFADTGELGAGFRFGEIFGFIKNNFVNILLAIVVSMLSGFVAQFGIILCLIGVIFTAAAATMIRSHAWGQVLRLDRARNNAPVTTTPAPRPAGAY